jgi:uncharacterized YigZ family protein
MFILEAPTKAEFTVKNSRFIAEAVYVDTPEGAKSVWHARKEQYDNGGHIVYAFITGPQGNIMGCSDDGEPSGTAGRPMLAVLKGSGLTNVIVTAARWFGGTKLGTGGLVRAYSDCARLALEDARVRELLPMADLKVVIPYSYYEQAKRLFEVFSFRIIDEEFGAAVTVEGELLQEKVSALKEELLELTCAKCRFLESF